MENCPFFYFIIIILRMSHALLRRQRKKVRRFLIEIAVRPSPPAPAVPAITVTDSRRQLILVLIRTSSTRGMPRSSDVIKIERNCA
jgi:hypothetical protein